MAELIVTLPGGSSTRHTLGGVPVVLGREPTCDIPLDDLSTSRRHARVFRDGGQYAIEDLESKNGTLLNEVPIKKAPLKPGDVVTLGAVSVLFQDAQSPSRAALGVTLIDKTPEPKSTRFSAPDSDLNLSRNRLRMLYDISSRLTQLRHRDELLQDAMDVCFETLRLERGAIGVRKPDSRAVEWPIVRNLYGRDGELTVSRTIVARALDKGERAVINDVGEEFDPTTSIVQRGIRSALCVPLAHQDRILGVIYGDRTSAGTQYTDEDVDFLAALARLVTAGLLNVQLMHSHAERVRLENELNLARRIQQGLFPRELPSTGLVRFGVLNDPGNLVSGDYYDVIPLTQDRIGFIMADVSGEGIAAAMVMAGLQAAVRVTLPIAHDLPQLMSSWNKLICDNTDNGKFVTALLGVLDPKRRKVTLVNAGHHSPYCIGPAVGQVRMLEFDHDPPLGVIESMDYQTAEFDLGNEPCTLFCYTDGVTEAMDSHRKLFGGQRLNELVIAHRSAEPRDLVLRIRDAIHTHRGDAVQNDDITMLAIRVEA